MHNNVVAAVNGCAIGVVSAIGIVVDVDVNVVIVFSFYASIAKHVNAFGSGHNNGIFSVVDVALRQRWRYCRYAIRSVIACHFLYFFLNIVNSINVLYEYVYILFAKVVYAYFSARNLIVYVVFLLRYVMRMLMFCLRRGDIYLVCELGFVRMLIGCNIYLAVIYIGISHVVSLRCLQCFKTYKCKF